SVSKTFRALIDSPYLISHQYNNSILTNSNINIIFGGERSLSYLNLDSDHAHVVNKIHNPLYFAIFETVILGSCNGIVCLCTTEPDNEIAFWNPVVRKFKKTRLAPAKCLEGVGRGVCVKGFGYDHVHDDFKELVYSKIEVFSLKTEAWKDVGDFEYLNVYANGCLHWLVSEKAEVKVELMIAAFDLADEEVRFVPKPEFVNEKVQCYGVKDSWSKLISTTDVKIVRELDFVRPIVYSKSGREVLLEKNFERLYWYHLDNKTVKRFKVPGMPRLFVSETFTASLVQVKMGNASQNVAKKVENDDKNRKKKDDFLSKGFRLVLIDNNFKSKGVTYTDFAEA
ncbi:hypothetical protein M8C21_024099, partial [Ambrosia artemisiifolia]